MKTVFGYLMALVLVIAGRAGGEGANETRGRKSCAFDYASCTRSVVAGTSLMIWDGSGPTPR